MHPTHMHPNADQIPWKCLTRRAAFTPLARYVPHVELLLSAPDAAMDNAIKASNAAVLANSQRAWRRE